MKPAPFEYELPSTEQKLMEILSEPNFEGKILAGGQSLLQMMSMRLVKPKVIVDINHIDEFRYIRDEGHYVAVGPLIRYQDLLEHPLFREWCPMIAEAVGYVGHRAIRNRGTVAGSIAHADPSAELPTVVTAIGAKMLVVDGRQEWLVEPSEFFKGRNQNCLQSGQLLREVRLPKIRLGEGQSFQEFSLRKNDPPLVATAVSISVDSQRVMTKVKGAIGGAGERPVHFEKEATLLIGQSGKPERFAKAASEIVKSLEMQDDFFASSAYQRELCEHLLYQGFLKAYENAQINQ